MLATRISNTCDPVHLVLRRRNRIVEIMDKYTHTEPINFEKYIDLLITILHKNLKRLKPEDILGRLFERNSRLRPAQELTPHELSEIMAGIVIQPEVAKAMPSQPQSAQLQHLRQKT